MICFVRLSRFNSGDRNAVCPTRVEIASVVADGGGGEPAGPKCVSQSQIPQSPMQQNEEPAIKQVYFPPVIADFGPQERTGRRAAIAVAASVLLWLRGVGRSLFRQLRLDTESIRKRNVIYVSG